MNPYETRQYLNEYLFFHYGRPKDFCPYPFAPRDALGFQQRIVNECLLPMRFGSPTRGLDVGCAVGRSTFELGRVVDHALGVDSSRQFIRAARRMAREHEMTIRVKEEGDAFSTHTVRLPARLAGADVEFQVGDAQDLSGISGRPFHVVIAINLIDRLPNPWKFLAQLPALVVPGGQLAIASPFTWMEQFTPRRQWIPSEQLPALLRPHFRPTRRHDLPFLIREHRRKYQWCVSEVTTYLRTATVAE
jgi:2-polyprenyl-3-methyl-5-hydroxy-6-metoxy-1,4-benzoquinol methylase